jgi:hypothetical protein
VGGAQAGWREAASDAGVARRGILVVDNDSCVQEHHMTQMLELKDIPALLIALVATILVILWVRRIIRFQGRD